MNDPRTTAYAAGELDAIEREAFERELATSADLQRELAETVAISDALSKSLGEPGDTLDDEARRALTAAFANRESARPATPFLRRVFLPALAACLIAMLALVSLEISDRQPSPDVAARSPEVQAPAGVALETASTVRTTIGKIEREIEVVTEPSAQLADATLELSDEMAQTAHPSLDEPIDLVTAPTVTMKSGVHAEVAVAPARPVDSGSLRSGSEVRRGEVAGDHAATTALAPQIAPGIPAERLAMLEAASEQQGRSQAETLPYSSAVPAAARAAGAPAEADSFAFGGAAVGGVSSGELRQQPTNQAFDTEAYDAVTGNTFLDVTGHPLSTFSIDVDTASYANVRRFLSDGQLPPRGAVRIEEFINYFPYALPQPEGDAPFSITTDVTRAPWNEKHLLARIALKGRDIATDKLPPSNLVFLIDVSGSMQPENKLPLLKRALRGLVDRLSPRDTVAIVTYAGSSGLVLAPTEGENKTAIVAALDRLESGGSTNGAGGIQLAYETARRQFLAEGNNRVILCTDGDFNVGVTSQSELVDLIERERKSGVFLSVLGFGTGNVKDSTMEKLADKGNGNYAYIDTPAEARKVLVEQMGATLFTIAKDVKIQVEFNPATVAGYRLLGYENRLLAKEDFNDDTKDAGEIGAGHTVTALYEIVPAGQKLPHDRSVDPLKYQPATDVSINPQPSAINELFTVKLRYKQPDGDTSELLERSVGNEVADFEQAPTDLRFATAVAAFGMNLRADKSDAKTDWSEIQRIARGSLGDDPGSYRAEFLTLVEKAKHLAGEESSEAPEE